MIANENTTSRKLEHNALAFMLAGNATFTLVSKKTGVRYTFNVSAGKNANTKGRFFVSYLTGPDNGSDYTYLGMVADGKFRLTKASKLALDSAPVKAFGYSFLNLLAQGTAPGVDIWHEGRCGRCGRPLTVPSSIELGLGPECAGKALKTAA